MARAGGAEIEAAFLRSIVQETLTVVDLEMVDYERMAELVEVYADFPLGTTDAAVVAVAEAEDAEAAEAGYATASVAPSEPEAPAE